MKICEKETEKVRGLRYEDLEVGDVFGMEIIGDKKMVAIRDQKGYTYLIHRQSDIIGKHFDGEKGCTARVKTTILTRYPNACVILGDPE